MNDNRRLESPFREAVAAIDAGDLSGLERLLAGHPELVRDRAEYGEGYFHRPYLLWFVAENPVRNGTLPGNILDVARAILRAARRGDHHSLQEQLDGTLGLVCSGRVARECGAQEGFIDLLVEAGAVPDTAMLAAIAHREVAAAERLLQQGAALTLPAAIGTGRAADVAPLARTSGPGDRQVAFAAAAFYGRVQALRELIVLGVDINAYCPPEFHPHGTPLHQAVDSGSLEAVEVLVQAGADLRTKDRVYQGTPLDWAEHLQRTEISEYLRGRRPGS